MSSSSIPPTPTPLFVPTPSAMLIGVGSDWLEDVAATMHPLKILKVAHVPAACERMVATWPLVVVFGLKPREGELEAVRATALDISAQVVVLAEPMDHPRARLELSAAKRAAMLLRG